MIYCRRNFYSKDTGRQNSTYYNVATPEEFVKKFGGDQTINKVIVVYSLDVFTGQLYVHIVHVTCVDATDTYM